ncbi:ribosome maturation factor RimP [Adhaeribacter rhizoryzae]|uniref:Ribosome maturation factor RimP n=1 Tax=Adhaeribacter rhizoryzae TaxID=2607907 RepID=A0A5M6DJ14_9BACT|nr:ribosome maturation factor [Adhaeribacter rhizoryzae]KAA5547548.1 ribosome maturation factor [Adhaeribacter rhizoryzae]
MIFTKQDIEKLAADTLPDKDLFIVGINVSDSAVKQKVTVIADGDNGISIDQCATISRRLGRRIEETYGEEVSYTLEVTSPGADQPLLYPRQYKRHVGRKLKLVLQDGSEKTGTLEAVSETGINLLEEIKDKKKITTTPVQLNYTDIAKSNIVISFK